jgi:hypothetical protein
VSVTLAQSTSLRPVLFTDTIFTMMPVMEIIMPQQSTGKLSLKFMGVTQY